MAVLWRHTAEAFGISASYIIMRFEMRCCLGPGRDGVFRALYVLGNTAHEFGWAVRRAAPEKACSTGRLKGEAARRVH